jgi:ADP-heptose:LPS heptosyltransferase
MNVDTMRRIDRLAGVPLCAVATVLLWFGGLFSRGTARPLRKILFVELSEMGTTILADPAMRKARQKLGAELFFVIFRKNVGSLDLLGSFPAENVFTIREDSFLHLAWDALAFLLWTRRKGIDTVIDLELFSRVTALLTGFAGAERRVGFYRFHNEGLYRGEMLTHRVAYNPHIHISKNLIALVDALLVAEPQVPYSKTFIGDDELTVSLPKPDEAARAAMLARIQSMTSFEPARQHMILINPNASELLPHRRWMPERYAELIRRILARHPDMLAAITGAPSERAEAEAMAAQCGERCVSLAGHTKLSELPALYSLAAMMVTNDSGPSHFAAAAGLPTLVLFGPETPKLYQPLGPSRAIYAGLACSPCVSAANHRKTACTNNVCMQAIAVDEVLAAVNEMLRA